MNKQRLPIIVSGISLLFLLYSCSIEEEITLQTKTELIENTKKWFDNTKESQNLTILKHTKAILWENAIVSNGDNGEIIEVPILLQDNKATSIGTTKELKDYHRLLFAKDLNDNYRSYDIQIFTNEPNFDNLNENFNFYKVNADFNGTITIFDGIEERTNFLNFNSSKKATPKLTHRDIEPMSEEYLCTFLGYLYANGTFEPFAILSCIGMGGGSDINVGSGTGGYGGSGSSTPNPTPETLPIKTLCDNLKEKQKNLALSTKLEDLRNKTSLHYESGFAEKLDGTFIELKNKGDNSLEFPIENNTIGFNHNHNDDYETDIDGETKDMKPIRMFSPADLKNFHILINKAYKNGITFDKIYGNMVINNATYTLTFTGDINSVFSANSINYKSLEKNYEKAMKSDNKAEALLLFMKNNIGIEGINLTKTDLSGNISVLTLDINNKLITIPCN